MEVCHLWRLEKVFKALKSLNTDFMHTYFEKGLHSARGKNDLAVNRAKTKTFSETSLRTLGPIISNFVTEHRFRNLQNSLKYGTDLNANAKGNICKYSGNPHHFT